MPLFYSNQFVIPIDESRVSMNESFCCIQFTVMVMIGIVEIEVRLVNKLIKFKYTNSFISNNSNLHFN